MTSELNNGVAKVHLKVGKYVPGGLFVQWYLIAGHQLMSQRRKVRQDRVAGRRRLTLEVK